MNLSQKIHNSKTTVFLCVKFIFTAICLSACLPAGAQIQDRENGLTIDADSVRIEFDREPYFGLYKDNYSNKTECKCKIPNINKTEINQIHLTGRYISVFMLYTKSFLECT